MNNRWHGDVAAMSYDTLERLCDFLDLEIIVRPKAKTSKRTSK